RVLAAEAVAVSARLPAGLETAALRLTTYGANGLVSGLALNTRLPWYCCTAVGVTVTVAVQLAPTASVAGQLLVSANPPVAETDEIGAGSGPGLVMVTVW